MVFFHQPLDIHRSHHALLPGDGFQPRLRPASQRRALPCDDGRGLRVWDGRPQKVSAFHGVPSSASGRRRPRSVSPLRSTYLPRSIPGFRPFPFPALGPTGRDRSDRTAVAGWPVRLLAAWRDSPCRLLELRWRQDIIAIWLVKSFLILSHLQGGKRRWRWGVSLLQPAQHGPAGHPPRVLCENAVPLRRGNNFHSWWCRRAAWMTPLKIPPE